MQVILIHGTFGNPYVNWFPWLAQKLEENKVKFISPNFPTPESQDYKSWKKLLDYYDSKGLINESSIFIGHSCGSIFSARYMAEKKRKFLGLISTSGYNNFIEGDQYMRKLNESFYVEDSALSILKTSVIERHCFFGDNDPYIPQLYFKNFANVLNAKSHVVHNGGHLNSNAGFNKFDDLLKTVMDIVKEHKK